MKAVILGTTGYTGMLLLRLLADHPDVDEIIPVSSTRFGNPAASVDFGIAKSIEGRLNLCKGNLVTLEEAAVYYREKYGVVLSVKEIISGVNAMIKQLNLPTSNEIFKLEPIRRLDLNSVP